MDMIREEKTTRSHRGIVMLMMALTGAVFFSEFILEDFPIRGGDISEAPMGLSVRYLIGMAIGGAIAGAIFARLFGYLGAVGWLSSLLGGILATLVAGLIGSAIGILPDLLADGWSGNDLIPILFGAAVIPLAIVDRPYLLLVWIALITITHLWSRRRRH